MSQIKRFLVGTGMVALSMAVIFFAVKKFAPESVKQWFTVA